MIIRIAGAFLGFLFIAFVILQLIAADYDISLLTMLVIGILFLIYGITGKDFVSQRK